jgi:DNA-binding MarR family transcriptional regulator
VHPDDSPSWSTSRQETDIDIGSSAMDQAVLNLRSLILAGEHYRQVVAEAIGLGTTESQALSYLAVNGSSGQSELARDLGLTSSALTALVDRLERQGVAERVRHPRDRRRTIVSLTERGRSMVGESHRWLTATLERIHPDDLELVSTSLAVIAADLSTRTSGDRVDDWADATHALPA